MSENKTSDLTKRLREASKDYGYEMHDLLKDAADEIERLEAENKEAYEKGWFDCIYERGC